MFIKIIALLSLIASLCSVPFEDHSLYMRGMQVVDLDYENDLVTCVDGADLEWQFYGCEDYCEGDIVCAFMDTMGTEDSIYDDVILKVNYSGFWME